LSSARGALASEKKHPAEMRASGEAPAIGIFVCKQILADTKALTGIIAGARKLASVVHAEEMQELCSRASLQQVTSAIAEHRLNRVVAVTCNPQAHEPLFQEALAEAGLNRYLLVMADMGNAGAQQTQVKRASDVIRMAVARAKLLEPLREISSKVAQRGLVIGSGLSALTAALSLADQGFDVCLVEQEKEGKSAGAKPPGKQVSENIKRAKRTLHKQITGQRRIELFTAARIIGFGGHPGCYTMTLSVKGAKKTLKHGIVIIEPGQVQEDLAVMLKIPVTPDGSYLRPDEMLPLDIACGGMFCCGYEDCREEMRRSIVHGRAAAARAATILAKRELILSSIVSVVDPERCVVCLACVRDCPYRAPAISEEGVAFIEPADCRGCGICVSVCPRKAIDLKHYTDEQILAELAACMDARS
ncbi:MAG: 4Fe-4S binding protein, partial [Proteobacteria bacterium]|nr:4Fe-4S binding protein [Pseudomonadota bacterium]